MSGSLTDRVLRAAKRDDPDFPLSVEYNHVDGLGAVKVDGFIDLAEVVAVVLRHAADVAEHYRVVSTDLPGKSYPAVPSEIARELREQAWDMCDPRMAAPRLEQD